MPITTEEMEKIFVYCSIAFGQGAGRIGISEDGVQALLNEFRPILTHHAPDWATEADRLLSYAESLGRVAAHVAIGTGKLRIDADSVTEARKRSTQAIWCLK